MVLTVRRWAREYTVRVNDDFKPAPIVPVGTKVLIREGRDAGIVVGYLAADSFYLVRFTDGRQATFTRNQLSIFRHEDSKIPGGPESAELYRYVIFRCIVGSQAYGLSHDGSDVDRRGIMLPPAQLHWSLRSIPEQIENDNEEVYWEVEKFIRLALKSNPNILECLYSPSIETCEPIAKELLDIRHIFLSKVAHRTYNAYVLSQFKKLGHDLRTTGAIRWKHAMHLIRLLLSGIEILEYGFVSLRVDRYRDRLLAIRRGEVAWEEVERWRLSLHQKLDHAAERTNLPAEPDYNAADAFLLKARKFAASEDYLKT